MSFESRVYHECLKLANRRGFVSLSIFSAEYWGVYRKNQMVVVKNIASSDTVDGTDSTKNK